VGVIVGVLVIVENRVIVGVIVIVGVRVIVGVNVIVGVCVIVAVLLFVGVFVWVGVDVLSGVKLCSTNLVSANAVCITDSDGLHEEMSSTDTKTIKIRCFGNRIDYLLCYTHNFSDFEPIGKFYHRQKV